ncbi:MAG: hypothetical protein PVG39_22730 [Desulfobacteraceae bacterium]|jgi:hypothetical protein
MNLLAIKSRDLKDEFDLTEKAADQAINEYPKTTDTELDIHQQNVIDHVSSSIIDSRNKTLEELNSLDSARNNIERDIESFSLNHIIEIAKNKIIRAQAEWLEVLENARQEEGSALRSYKYFIYVNKLKREASYPESSVLHWAFIVLAVLLESVVNSFFFASASDLGILGGFFQALFISLSNIGSALLIGIYVLPYKNHVDTKKASRAKLLTTFYIAFVFLFNLLAAHYRTLLEEDALNAKINAIPHMINDPLGINFEAWNLLIIGMLFVFVAILKGYKSDDVYPGFGEVHRNYKNASNHRGKKVEAMKSINRIIDDCTMQAKSYIQNVNQKIKSYKDLIFQSEEVITNFAKEVSMAENACNNMLWEYRNANVRVRSTKPPQYFSQKHSFKNYLLEAVFTKERTNINRIESHLNAIQNDEEQKLSASLSAINEKALEDITRLFEKAE